MRAIIQWKKWVACLLATVLLTTSISTSVFAAVPEGGSGNSDSYNIELLRLLEEEYGTEQASAMLEMIQKLGLIDANGQLMNYAISFNGNSYTLEEIKQLLADESTDLSQLAEVDGEAITLAALKQMIEIEERFSGLLSVDDDAGLNVSSEHLDSLDSLLSQIEGDGGLRIVDENGNSLARSLLSSTASGMNYQDETVVSATYMQQRSHADPNVDVVYIDITFQLNRPQAEEVSFSYERMDSTLNSLSRYDGVIQGTVVFAPGETTKKVTLSSLYATRGNVHGYCRTGRNDFESSLSSYQQNVWYGYGRADYVHFYDFNNLDRIDFSSLENDQKYVPFTHAYEGGGYLSFALGGRALYQYDSINGVGFGDCYARGDRNASAAEPSMLEVKVKDGSYTTGQIIPMQVLYSNIISREQPGDLAGSPRLTLAGGGVAYPDVNPLADFRHTGNVVVLGLTLPSLSLIGGYMAVVEKGMTTDDLKVVGASDETAAMPLNSPYQFRKMAVNPWGNDFTNTPNIVINSARADAFQSLTLDKANLTIGQTLHATLQLTNASGEADWLLDGVTTPEEIAKRVMISIGDRNQGLLELNWKLGQDLLPLSPPVLEGQLKITQSIYDTLTDADPTIDGKQLRAKVYYNRNLTPGALDIGDPDDFGMLANEWSSLHIGMPKFITSNDVAITYPASWPSGTPYVVNLIDATATKLDFTYPLDATHVTPDQFEWRSSDVQVADIMTDGTIIPKKAGTVTFTLAAKNNGEAAEATVDSQTITISADGSAAVVVPSFANRVYVNKNKDATIVWSTNVMDRYKELAGAGNAPADANFKLEFFEGFYDDAQLAGQQPTKVWEAPTVTELINATSFTIPGQYITDISSQHVPSYTVRISTVNPENEKSILSAISYIVVRSDAAVVTLDKSMGQFVLDSIGTLPVRWTLDHFDPINRGEFEFQVTKNGVLIPNSRIVFDQATGQFSDAQATATGGSYALNIDPVTTSNRIKDVYTITLAVKNSMDSTWSYDSLYLQVYKSDALQILIDGQSVQSHTMTNNDQISKMTSDQILALKRNITLNNELGINHKDYDDLGELTDQIAWKSDNNQIGGINYRSGGYIEDIETFNNSSYQPKQNFLLAGLNNGQTKITATHARTGIKRELDLTVETLQDKLYLFQLYPKTETTLTYTNGAGAERTMTTDENGELALYEESGIASDVYVTSVFGGSTYTGVYSKNRLLSKEGNPAYFELYPVNILQLRQLSKIDTYFKMPNGKPYTGKVTYRGGVYKNGYYAEAAEIGGTGVIEDLGEDGKLEITFDTTDFYSRAAGELNAADLSAKDKLEFVIEVQFDNNLYHPSLLTFDGDASPVDRILIGDKIAYLLNNTNQQPTPIIVNQYVKNGDVSSKTDIRDYRGKFGPNDHYPSIYLTTELLWWGEEVNEEAYAELENAAGLLPQGQSYQTIKYPFSDMWLTRHVQLLNKDTIWLDKAQSGSVHFKLYDGKDSFRKSFTSTPTLVNMIGVPEVSRTDLRSSIQKLKNDMNSTNGGAPGPSNNDKVALESLSLLGNVKMDVGPLSMRVYPTDDPMVFKMIMSASEGSIASTQGSSDVELFQSNNGFVPGVGDMYKIAMNTYLEQQKRTYKESKQNRSGNGIPFTVGGYYVGEIKYNVKTDGWEAVVHGGGFNAGGGFEYSWNWNVQAGFVPVTFSLTIGGGVEVGFKASVLFDEVAGNSWSNPEMESVNDYLTSLRIVAYIEAFGGIGFDYSVIAAKIGVFGRITLENTSTWLNRDYLQNSNDRVLYGNKLTMESIVGVRVVLKFLFISIKHDFASFRYSHSWLSKNWNKIEDYWNANAVMPITAANVDTAIMAYMQSIGEDPMQVLSSQTMEDRSYLNDYGRAWNAVSGHSQRMLLAAASSGPAVLQSNAYPYANPQVAADGSLFVYLSDGNSTNIEDTVASWAVRNGQGGYDDRGEIVTDPALNGYGDTGLQLAGEGNRMAAVWVRQKDTITKDAGEELTASDVMLMNNSAEIMASIYDGTRWTTHRLTDNQSPDVAPVVSVSNDKVVVAYRSVYSSNVNNPLDFTESDSIMYTVYDVSSGTWSEADTLYNGTNGTVMGISAAMLTDGTAAVAYTVNIGNVQQIAADQYVAGMDNEVVYAVIDTTQDRTAPSSSWKTTGVVKNLQVTHDRNANENPQLTSVIFADGTERFVMAWHTTSDIDDNVTEDIRMLAINRDGEVYPQFVDSLSDVKDYNEVRINPNFTFVQMPQAYKQLEHLSLIWKEAEVDASAGQAVSRDVMKAVKLGMNGGELYLSGVMELGAMPDDTAIDSISAYIGDRQGKEIKALLLGTTYTTDTEVVGTITPKGEGQAGGDEIPVTVSKTVSAMYTASASYHNEFNADYVVFNPNEIVQGYDMPVQFHVVNQGLSPIQSVDITISGELTRYDQMSLVPNSGQSLTAYHTIPSPIVDAPYQVEVTFADGEILTTTGTLELDIPDTGISKIKVMKEEDGKRVLSIPVYNKNGTTLGNKGRSVKLAMYEDNSYDNDSLIGSVMDISDADDLELVDQGAYVEMVEFDVQAYLTKHGLQEIPEKGITIYLRSWVEDAGGEVLKEFDETDNEAKITLDNLAVKYNENRVLLTLEQMNDATHTNVNLTMQNMNMASVSSGNVLLQLLDDDGHILETKYVASGAASLLSFGPEEKKTAAVQFNQAGKSVQGVFFHENADQRDATLSTVKLSGIAIDFDPNQNSYALQTSDLKQTKLIAVASNSESTITVMNGEGAVIGANKGFISLDQTLSLSTAGSVNEWQIEVQPVSGAAPNKTYLLAVENTESSKPQLDLTVRGTKISDGTYSGQVEVALSPYTVDGFSIDKALYKVNNGNWQETAYDGKAEKSLETLTADGVYRVAAKVVLASGMTYELTPAVFEIKTGAQPAPGPTPTPAPTPAPSPTPAPVTPVTPVTPAPTIPKTATSIFKSDLINWEALLQSMKDRLSATNVGEKVFLDTQQHWAKQMIDWLARLGVVNGYADGTFRPNNSITRAEFAAIIVRLFMLKSDDDLTAGFVDVQGHWAKNDIAILSEYGIVKGYQNGSFRPNATITREEMITIVMRLIDESLLPQGEETQFDDWSKVSSYAQRSILAASAAGIIQGYNGELRPQGEATRAEIVAMLWKLLMLNPDMEDLY